jgi:hypothetical protein
LSGNSQLSASNGWINRFKRRYNIVYRTLSGKSKTVDLEVVVGWSNYQLLQETEDYDLYDTYTYNADETGLFLNLQTSKPLLFGEIFAMVV